MPGPNPRRPAARHAGPDSISRRRFVRVALVLGLVPAGAAAIDWFARHGAGDSSSGSEQAGGRAALSQPVGVG